MKIQPRTEQEIVENQLWKAGAYDFEVLEACEKTSNAGNQMIELKLRLSDGAKARTLIDRLLDETPAKTRHACAVCGLLDQYDTGELSADEFVGKGGRLRLVIEKKKGYRDKNAVADYLTEDAATAPATPNVLDMLRKRVGAA